MNELWCAACEVKIKKRSALLHPQSLRTLSITFNAFQGSGECQGSQIVEARFFSVSEQLQFSMDSLSAPIPRAPGDGGEHGASRD